MIYKADDIQVARLSWQRNVTAWLYVPVGILIMLLACFGVNALIGLSSVSFPASVALLVVLFFGLMICDWILGDRKTRALVNVIDVPVCSISRYYGYYVLISSGWMGSSMDQYLLYSLVSFIFPEFTPTFF